MASSRDPAEVFRASAGRTHYTRLTRLLMSGGTTILRELFDSIHPPAYLPTVLKSPTVYSRLSQIKKKKFLTLPQWKALFPSPGTCGQSKTFDITLLCKLFRNICSLTKPATGWDSLPNSTDISLTADLARIKYYRNEIYGHVNEDMELRDEDFVGLWNEIKEALIRIVNYYALSGSSSVTDWENAIENLLTAPLTDEDEIHLEELEHWYLEDMEVKRTLEENTRATEENTRAIEETRRTAEETRRATEETRDFLRTLMKTEKRVEALETAIETRSSQEAIITFQAPNRIPCFHGRDDELEILNKPLEKKSAPCSMTSICGLGGTGKTSLAIEHIWRNKEVYSGGVFWISGESNKLFRISVDAMARKLRTSFDEDFKMTLSKTLDWLEQRKQYWCLVIDNLDELELSTEMLKLLTGHWKREATGHILVTTRRQKNLLKEEVSDVPEESFIQLENLSETEGIQLIKMKTGRAGTEDDAVIYELVVELGTLPLALDQAAAFIKNKKEISFSQYLDQYKKQKLQMLKRSKAHYPAEDTSKDRIAVNTTWELNFEYVSRLSEEYGIGQAAALVMEVSAFLSPDDIPQEIINQGLPEVDNEDFINCVSTSFGVSDIVGVLTKFSLFQTFTDNSFSVHRLVQEVIRSRISQEHLKDVLLCACRMLCYAFANARSPADVCKSFEGDSVFSQENLPSLHLWGKLGAHASVLQKYLIQNSQANDALRREVLYTEESATIINEASLYLSVCRQNNEAMELQESKLNVLTQLQVPLPEEKLNRLGFFDIPLKNIEFKLISHCMTQQSICDENTKRKSESDGTEKEKANQLREKGNDAVRQQNYDEAINLYTEAIEYNKDDPRLYNNRAHCKLMLGKPEEALLDCELCLKLEERNGKALMRKAWALYELSKTQGEKLKGRMRAAAALAAHVDPIATNGKRFKEMFPNLIIEEIVHPLQLAGSFMFNIPEKTLLLHEGYYELYGTTIDEDVQLVALNKGVRIKFKTLPIFYSSFYAEGIIFAKDSGSIICRHKGSINLVNCKLSGGFSSCEDYPECNGGTGCVAVKFAGRKPCDRTSMYGEEEVSGITGNPSVHILLESNGNVENCDVVACGGGGILCQGEGSHLTVKSCRVHNNRQAGLEVREGGCLIAINNEIYANGYHGMLIGPCSNACEIVENRIYENNKDGIVVVKTMEQDKIVVEKNRIFHNLAFGISLESCNSKIKRNEIFENGFYGIHAKNLTTALVESNDIYSNKCGGINIDFNFLGCAVITSNSVRDHSGPGIQHERESIVFLTMADNVQKNNKENKASYPRKKIESIQSECAFCRSTKNLQRCPGCNIASYCNSTCQERHWEKHRALCSALKDQYSVTVEPKKLPPKSCGRLVGPHLKGSEERQKPEQRSNERFIVKMQTQPLNCHPLQNLTVCDKSHYIDGFIQNPEIFHVIMECGVLEQMNRFTSKKAYFYATFADGGKS